ncbi:MAG: bacteriocin family protein [Planctomycetaceae bacterium]|nr:bacteriocin family protein [Planctomycetaceae bacterium]
MRYLMRDGAPLTEDQWQKIDEAVVTEASRTLVGRRFLDVRVVGAQAETVHRDVMERADKAAADFWARDDATPVQIDRRDFLRLTTVYSDFMVSWRDIDNPAGTGVQAAREAAILAARREDDIIFHGLPDQGIDGILTAPGTTRMDISDWSVDENPVMDLAKGLETLIDNGSSGSRALFVSTDLYAKLHRIQHGTGIMEVDRVRSLVGKLFRSSRLKKNSAILLYTEPQYIDLVIGQDMITAYMGNEKLDHVFRVMETLVPRIKRPEAIVIYG